MTDRDGGSGGARSSDHGNGGGVESQGESSREEERDEADGEAEATIQKAARDPGTTSMAEREAH